VVVKGQMVINVYWEVHRSNGWLRQEMGFGTRPPPCPPATSIYESAAIWIICSHVWYFSAYEAMSVLYMNMSIVLPDPACCMDTFLSSVANIKVELIYKW